jgi:hypothetical protein
MVGDFSSIQASMIPVYFDIKPQHANQKQLSEILRVWDWKMNFWIKIKKFFYLIGSWEFSTHTCVVYINSQAWYQSFYVFIRVYHSLLPRNKLTFFQ